MRRHRGGAFKQDQCTEQDQPRDPADLAVGTRARAVRLMASPVLAQDQEMLLSLQRSLVFTELARFLRGTPETLKGAS